MKHPDPNATIQLDRIDRIDDVQLDDMDPSAPHAGNGHSAAPRGSGRPNTSSGPPPLPPGASLPPSTSYAPLPTRSTAPRAPSKPAGKGKTVVQAVLFVALLGAAIVGGLKWGASLRGAPSPAKAVVQDAPPAAAAPLAVQTPAASASAPGAPAVLTMPTIEMSDPPAESK